jgi:hypothetical protein
MSIEEREGQRLVELARDAILHELGGPPPARPSGPRFDAPGATFVTVTRDGQLHGCIGSIAPRRGLASDVEHNAVAAAFMDPRSQAYRAEWLGEMGVEVTLLGPLAPLHFKDQEDLLRQLVPHVDGLVLRWGRYRGTFLPQVWDSLEDPREFLSRLKEKAGLAADFWAEDVEVSRFHVQKWSDRRGGREAGRAQPRVAS